MAKGTSIKQKRALILVPYLKNGDGTAVAIMNYYDALIENGWYIDFIHLKTTDCPWLRKVKSNGGNVYELPNKNKYSKSMDTFIESVIKRGHYDIVHVNMPGHIGYITLKLARRYGVKRRIFHAHNPKNTLNLKTIVSTDLYDFLIEREASELIACAKSTGEERFRNKPFKVIRNVIDVEKFTYNIQKRVCIREKLNADGNVIIGVVGRYAAQKNPLFLLECFAEYKKINNSALLVWIGDGELKRTIENKAQALGIRQSCYFVGRKDNVEDWYSAMDLFLLPSKFEGLGIVFLEAQCTGLPCLGSTSVPIETEVTELMHRMELKCNAKQWAAEMESILETQQDRYSRAEKFIDAGYAHEATRNDLMRIYNKIDLA